jgi:hypothetical protein
VTVGAVPRQRAAARPDGVNVDRGNLHRQVGDRPLRVPANLAIDQAHVGRRTAHVEGDDSLGTDAMRRRQRADHTGGRPGEQRANRLAARRLHRYGAAVRLHHPQTRLADTAPQRAQVTAHHGCNVSVDHRGAQPFVLAILGHQLVRQGARDAEISHRPADCALVPRLGIGVKEADGNRLGAQTPYGCADGLYCGARERHENAAVEGRALRDTEAMASVEQRLGLARLEGIDVGTSLPGDLEEVFEARRGEQNHACSAALQQRVGGDRRPVRDVDRRRRLAIGKQVAQSLHNGARRIVGCRRDLVKAQAAALEADEIGERAAGVDTDERDGSAPTFHRRRHVGAGRARHAGASSRRSGARCR